MKKFKVLKLMSVVLASYTLLAVSSQGMADEYLSLNSEATVLEHEKDDSEVLSPTAFTIQNDETVGAFIQEIEPIARKLSMENNLYLSVMIAQAVLESAGGESKLAQAPHYNLFGIKEIPQNGGNISENQDDAHSKFRQYNNYEESLTDYAHVLKDGLKGNPNFYSGVWKSNAASYKEATQFLRGRYATDPEYDQKLNTIIETYNLDSLDSSDDNATVNSESALFNTNTEATTGTFFESDNGFQVPLKNYTISSKYGMRGGEFHRGIDFAVAQGEPIYASQAGTVIKSEFHSSWGNYVAIEHADKTTTLYAHQQKYTVQVGDRVEQGQLIGYVGSTGNSTGAHLHFEICLDNTLSQNKLIDPETKLF